MADTKWICIWCGCASDLKMIRSLRHLWFYHPGLVCAAVAIVSFVICAVMFQGGPT